MVATKPGERLVESFDQSQTMKTSTLVFSLAALLGAGTLLADDPQWQMQRDTQRRLAEQNRTERYESNTTVALYTHGRGAGERERVTTRDTEDRPVIVQQGRGDHLVIRPTAR